MNTNFTRTLCDITDDVGLSGLNTIAKKGLFNAGAILKVLDNTKSVVYVYDPYETLPFRRADNKEQLMRILYEIYAREKRREKEKRNERERWPWPKKAA